MSGTAVFEPRPDGLLHYVEEGVSALAGEPTPLRFTRSYLYGFSGDVLRILFDEAVPRLFQDVLLGQTPSGWEGSGRHECAPDLYVSQYVFDRAGSFRMRHEVEGPRKAYVIETSFARSVPT